MQSVYLAEINKLKEQISSLTFKVAPLSGPQQQGGSQPIDKVARSALVQVTRQAPAVPVINKSDRTQQTIKNC